MRNKLSAGEIYNLLLEDKITNQTGEFRIDFAGINTKVSQKSGVGDLFQEWFSAWLDSKNIWYRTKSNTQEFPDFLLDESDQENLLEVKVFNNDASPNFDVANFLAYINSLTTNAYRLDAKYLIFGYTLNNNGDFQIKNIWLKEIEEITGKSQRYPIKCQVKSDVIVNIRPITWFSQRGQNPFHSKREFVNALKQTINQYNHTKDLEKYKRWFSQVKKKYYEQTGKEL